MNTIKWLILSSLLAPLSALAQSTTVTATVVDPNSVVWANGTYNLQFVPNPNASGNPTWNGNPFPVTQWSYSGVLNASGQFSQSVPSNNFIAPAGSTYTATICPNTSAACTVILRLTFQGTSQDMSATITNAIQPMAITALPVPRAYNDAEMAVQNTQAGYIYQNVTANTPRYWNGSAWGNFGGTVAGVTVGSLPPLFTTATGGTGTNPAFTFTAPTQGANSVYGNCTTGTATPSFCALTAAMLPGTLTSNTSGNAATATAASQSDHTPTTCTGNNFAIGVGALWNASCAQPAFSNLSGNIAMTQINGGTNANNTHYLRGDNTWATLPTIPNIQSASASSVCTTTTSTFNACSVSINWPVAFADSAYQAVCFGVSPNDARANINGILTKTASGVTVQLVTLGSVAVTYGTVDCIAVHP